jgi:uncharacterized protein YndB with AHSA1/START domain
MPKARRSRLISAPPSAVWRVVSDPYHLSRWWPKVARVESVQERQRGAGTVWTKVFETKAGRVVRADFRCLYAKEPVAYRWEQEVEDSPFRKVFRSAVTNVQLSEEPDGTRVELETDQRLRGLSRLGGFMVKRATQAQLDEALAALDRAVTSDREAAGKEPRD